MRMIIWYTQETIRDLSSSLQSLWVVRHRDAIWKWKYDSNFVKIQYDACFASSLLKETPVRIALDWCIFRHIFDEDVGVLQTIVFVDVDRGVHDDK